MDVENEKIEDSFYFLKCSLNLVQKKKFQNINLNRPLFPMPQILNYSSIFAQVPSTLIIQYTTNSKFSSYFQSHITETLTNKNPDFILQDSLIPYEEINPGITLYKREFQSFCEKATINSEKKNQAYFLKIDESGCKIYAKTEVGLYYGLIAFSQLIFFQQNTWVCEHVEIFDFPDFILRGISEHFSSGHIPKIYANAILCVNIEAKKILTKLVIL